MPVTRAVFEAQCKRRFGAENPERMHLEHWEWMVRSGADPFFVRQELGLESNFPRCGGDKRCERGGPDWCFKRFGMSRVRRPDGRIICIGGEHEDSYDPDFCIYNDVIVLRPAAGQAEVSLDSGEVEIYGYPEAVFPPTDAHSATLVDGRIIVIGRLGYAGTRCVGVTPVFSLDTATYRIEAVHATGPSPGWIFKHNASYDAARHAITVRGGNIWSAKHDATEQNLAAYRLHLTDLRWELIAAQETHGHFILQTNRDVPRDLPFEVFRPISVPYQALDPDPDAGVYRMVVEGVRIDFDVGDLDRRAIRVLIEGNLPSETTYAVLLDVANNLQQATGWPWSVEPDDDKHPPAARM